MISIEDVCTFLNRNLVERSETFNAVLRTLWHLNPNDIPDDIEVYAATSGSHVTDLVGILNGLFCKSGKRIASVRVNNQIQFVVESNEKV
ncbi:hypothetical protein JA33_160 [Dickeya phage vB_DsoM_JA33]|uniref:Uncharacterized protein n=4 Tax=Salmondvirus TaxID=2733130 RepID=A0A384ZWC5_9CAUD|nr:hypothetical protein HOU08_gp162 [Dickeya phage vB_DsoM_JA29]YP_009813605.1 hypothetical protein HOU32_gp160 [Dickeya phage vB_DsoM_JA11]AXG66563.1 hypothetical protein JA13_160 [Dickeya phage vB_DsoM_JA13]AXG67534.1 hypothetical protein JA33_160 [Dickeya phage vB_DsoM_JA33]AXG66888.1 hypothetical protein JA29_162 [Dickeya phage vB_DsoM_JA29]AYD79965.1 hypothetical protein JA11_160 [Dickeya phage vB_DsoM_JA11]